MSCEDIAPAAGTTLAMSATAPATENKAGYEALTFTEVAEIESIGPFGKVFQVASFSPLKERSTYKRKGTYDSGGLDLSLAIAPEDTGQDLLRAALESDVPYTFQVQLNDATATLDEPSAYYFRGLVTSYQVDVGSDPNRVVMATARIEICGDIVTVDREASA